MDFFESQDLARRNTKLLIVLFSLAILVLVVLTKLLVLLIARYVDPLGLVSTRTWEWETFGYVALFVILTIGAGSLSRVASLRRGGSAVAEALDGEILVSGQNSPAHQQLLNVVEEMAIASGSPVPQVYVIPDPSINAFAAGYTPGDAVIGVTEGCVRNLSRDELQGVIGHEFSHILNGDMRLNIQMMGALYGIYMLSVVGRMIATPGTGTRSTRARYSGSGGLIGIGMFVVGYLGQLFGRLIKAAISRQREFLADASAVQFTRNPSGIADALKKIGGNPMGSVVDNPKGEEVSHAFFAEGIKVRFAALFSTHPKLDERIRRIQPWWRGGYIQTDVQELTDLPVSGLAPPTSVESLVDMVGQMPEVSVAREIFAGIPRDLWEGVHEPYVARAVVYLMLLDDDEEVRARQLEHLERHADFGVYDTVLHLLDYFPVRQRLPLAEMALSALRQLSEDQYRLFKENIDALINANAKISVAEWALRKFVTHNLDAVFLSEHHPVKHRKLKRVTSHCRVLLSMLAYSSKQHKKTREQVFEEGRVILDLDMSLLERSSLSLSTLDVSVDALAGLTPLRKPRLLKACVATILADGVVTATEEEVVRTIANVLDCPMPPIDQTSA